jgi:hypothetical protein
VTLGLPESPLVILLGVAGRWGHHNAIMLFSVALGPGPVAGHLRHVGPDHIWAFAEGWLQELPTPFTPADQAAGYWWELSMRQVEVSRTMVFTAPRHARGLFEALIADNLDLGRPDHVDSCDHSPPPTNPRTAA